MGNVLKILSQQPQIDSTPKIKCPICYLPCRQFKKLHKIQWSTPPLLAFPVEMNYLNIGTNLNAPFVQLPFIQSVIAIISSVILVKKSKSYQLATATSKAYTQKNQFVCSV